MIFNTMYIQTFISVDRHVRQFIMICRIKQKSLEHEKEISPMQGEPAYRFTEFSRLMVHEKHEK